MVSSTLTCPKCAAPMRTYERNQVHVDQCTECRGIFLDRGELERLVDAEASHYDGQSPAPTPRAEPRYDDRGRGDYRGGYVKKKSKTSFLGDLLDM